MPTASKPKAPKRPRRPRSEQAASFPTTTEHDEQAALITWTRYIDERVPELKLLFAVPNGEYRPITVAKRLKAEGVKAGVLDLILLVPRRGFHGCIIEMKRPPDGRLSTEQEWWSDQLEAQGYCVFAAWGWIEAARHLCWYLGLDPVDFGVEW